MKPFINVSIGARCYNRMRFSLGVLRKAYAEIIELDGKNKMLREIQEEIVQLEKLINQLERNSRGEL